MRLLRCLSALCTIAIACGGGERSSTPDDGGTPSDAPPSKPPTSDTPEGGTPSTDRQVALGRYFSCALIAGTVSCWGENNSGELGNGKVEAATNGPTPTPQRVGNLGNAVEIAPHEGFTCARIDNGEARCWGTNTNGAIGDAVGTPDNRTTPTPVCNGPWTSGPSCVHLTGILELAAGPQAAHECARLADGTVRCWGDDTYGEFGDGKTGGLSLYPVPITGLNGATQLTVGTSHTCALYADATVQCVGRNSYGDFGNGALGDGTSADRATLAPVVGLANVVQIAAGAFHTCAVLGDGTVRCWGGNTYGQCGDGTRDDLPNQGRLSPVQVSGITNAVRVAAGEIHTCALLADKTVACWGTNAYGNLGTGAKNDTHLTPVPVAGLSGVVTISVGSYHSCALLEDGTVKCWGDNGWGELGDGTTIQRLVPTTVPLP